MIDNTDDHVKNHGVLHVSHGQYRLAPAFDVVMQLKNTGYQELAIVAGNNNSSMRLAKEASPYFGINNQDAENIIQSIHAKIHDELIGIVDYNGANDALKQRVKRCIERQHDLIYSQ